MDNNIHADEKCFFMTKTAVKYYLRFESVFGIVVTVMVIILKKLIYKKCF